MATNVDTNHKITKPDLGGWKNKLNGLHYLNADSQTGPSKDLCSNQCSEFSQTSKFNTTYSQTHPEKSTQMWRLNSLLTKLIIELTIYQFIKL